MMRVPVIAATAALLLAHAPASGAEHHHHGGADKAACSEPTLACATAATPFVTGDGHLWLTWVAGGRVSAARSDDLGRSFHPAVAVTPEPAHIDTGPDARPRIVVDRDGRIYVSYAVF